MRLGHFTVDNVQKILRNKIYIGVKVYQHKGEWKEVKAVWDAIIDEVTFARVSELLTHNKTKLRVKSVGNRYPYILTGITFCKNCGNFMPGKSATGKTKKIPYYEHSWATKKDSCLSKKLFKCDPHRVPAQKLEPLVWGEFLKLLEDEKFILELREKVKSIHAGNDVVKDGERLKSKLYGLNSQIESLAERLAILPKTISPAPIFKQMEKLEQLKNETSAKLMNVKTIDLEQRLVPLETFSEFAGIVKKALTKNDDGALRKKVLQKFVSRVEVGVDKVRIAWNVDRDHYNREIVYGGDLEKNAAGNLGQKESTPATAGVVPVLGLKKNLNFIWCGSSNSLTNGAPLQRVVELSRLIISRSCRYHWSKSTTNYAMLARLRWIAGHNTKKLAQQFQVTEATVRGYLSMLRHSGKLQKLDLSAIELSAIQNKIKRELNYEQTF